MRDLRSFVLAFCLCTLTASGCSGAEAEAVELDESEADSTARGSGASVAESRDVAQSLKMIPAAFHGLWDVPGDFACTDLSADIARVEGQTIGYYETLDDVQRIEAVSATTVKVDTHWVYADDSGDESYTLILREGGKTLSFEQAGFEPTVRVKCPAGLEELGIPQRFRGKWATFSDDCRGNLMTVRKRSIESFGKTDAISNVQFLDEGIIEAVQKTQNGDEPFGLTLSDDGKTMTMSGPGHSGIPFTRCS